MQTSISPVLFVGGLGAVQALVIGLALATRDRQSRWLGAMLVLLGVAMGLIVLSHSPWGREGGWILLGEVTVSVLVAPLFYLWILMAWRDTWKLRAVDWLHFLPAALWSLHAMLLALGLGDASLLRDQPVIRTAVAYQMLYTLLAAWRVFVRPRGRILNSDRFIMRGAVAMFVLIHLAQLLRMSVEHPLTREIVPLTAASIILVLTVLAVRHSRLFEKARRAPELDPERAGPFLRRLHQALDDKRLYLQPDLTLDALAQHLAMPRGRLSALINQHCGVSFLQLVNQRRVAEAERLLGSPEGEHLTVEAIAGRAGFGSRSAFYDAFKRHTGQTPAAFRDQLEPPA